jgi:hypothetical protein
MMQNPGSQAKLRSGLLWDVVTVGLLLFAASYLHGTAGYHRYSYYESLRNWVTIAWIAGGIRFYAYRWYPVTVLAALVTLLFNPVSPITVRKWQGQPYDHWTMILSVGAAAALACLAVRAHKGPASEEPRR